MRKRLKIYRKFTRYSANICEQFNDSRWRTLKNSTYSFYIAERIFSSLFHFNRTTQPYHLDENDFKCLLHVAGELSWERKWCTFSKFPLRRLGIYESSFLLCESSRNKFSFNRSNIIFVLTAAATGFMYQHEKRRSRRYEKAKKERFLRSSCIFVTSETNLACEVNNVVKKIYMYTCTGWLALNIVLKSYIWLMRITSR